jgi:aryl-alcohol dehydrogenase-like predicted oxidoreductase
VATDDWRSKRKDFHGDGVQRNVAVVEQLKRLAESWGMTITQLAIAWVLAQPAIDVAIVGACNPEQLAQNTLAGDRYLTQQTLQEIERMMREAVPIGGPAPEGM